MYSVLKKVDDSPHLLPPQRVGKDIRRSPTLNPGVLILSRIVHGSHQGTPPR